MAVRQELYLFVNDRGEEWRFTSADDDIVYDGNTWEFIPIERDDFSVAQDPFQADLAVRITKTHGFSSRYVAKTPDEVCSLTIFSRASDDLFYPIWKGRVVGSKVNKEILEISLQSIYTRMQNAGVRAVYSYGCRHALYDQTPLTCGVDKEQFRVDGSVTAAIRSAILTIPEAASKPDGWFQGGFCVIDGIQRFISAHSGQTITLSRAYAEDPTEKDVTMYAGCDHTMATCKAKFGNLSRFGGQPDIPVRNIFGGNKVT